MKKLLKYTLSLLLISLIVFAYFYLKPALTISQLSVAHGIPIKVGPYSSRYNNDSVIVYIPYKFEVTNNRFRKISIGDVWYKENFSGNHSDLYFDNDGFVLGRGNNQDILDGMLEEQEYIDRLYLYYNKEVFPFSDKVFYFYKAFLVGKSKIKKGFDWKQPIELVNDFSKNQSLNLYNKSKFQVSKETIDSLYQSDNNGKIIFNFKYGKDSYSNWYQINYYINTDKQTLIDYSKMTQAELVKKLGTKIDFEK